MQPEPEVCRQSALLVLADSSVFAELLLEEASFSVLPEASALDSALDSEADSLLDSLFDSVLDSLDASLLDEAEEAELLWDVLSALPEVLWELLAPDELSDDEEDELEEDVLPEEVPELLVLLELPELEEPDELEELDEPLPTTLIVRVLLVTGQSL